MPSLIGGKYATEREIRSSRTISYGIFVRRLALSSLDRRKFLGTNERIAALCRQPTDICRNTALLKTKSVFACCCVLRAVNFER